MKSLNESKIELEQIEKELRQMKDICETEEREPNDEERERASELLDRADELEKMMKLEERRLELEDKFKEPDDETKKKAKAVIPDPDDEKKRSKDMSRYKKTSGIYSSLGEQLRDIIQAGLPGQKVPRRLHEVRQASGLGEAVGADGGFLLQEDFSSELLMQAFQTGVLPGRCRRMTLSGRSNSIKIPGVDETSRASTRWGGILGYWADEAALKTASKPKFRRIELNLNKLIGLCYMTDELLEDVMALEGYVRQGFSEEFGFQMDDAIINGSGVGRPLGILNAGSLVSASAETGQAAGTVIYENIMKMWPRIFANSQPSSIWLINQSVWPQLFAMSLAVGTGGAPVFLPPGGASDSPYSTLMGRPVIPIEQCAAVGTVGDIILADFSGYILASKGGMQSDMSIHVRFIYDESVIRFVYRVDGQPVLASAVTPYKGGSSWTQSHFVALATR